MKAFYTILLAIFIVGQSFAQIKEKQVNISLGVQPCLVQDVQDVKKKQVEKLWKKFFKEYGKVKKNSKAKEYYSSGVRVKRILSGNPIDVYAKFEEFANGVDINLCFDLGTEFLSKKTTPNDYGEAEEFLHEFVVYVNTYVIEKQLEDEEDMLKDLKKDLKSTRKKNKKLHDKIDKYTKKIKDAEEDIDANLLKQDELGEKIEDQILKVKLVQEKLRNVGK